MDFITKGLSDVAHVTEGVANVLNPFGHNSQEKRESEIGPIERSCVAIIDGKRVGEMKSILDKSDTLILSGEMIFAFYKAQGYKYEPQMKSLPAFYKAQGHMHEGPGFPVEMGEEEEVNLAKSILEEAETKKVEILLPTDVVVVERLTYYAKTKVVPPSDIPDGWIGVDIGPESIELFNNALSSAKTVMWEGDIYEFGKFDRAIETFSTKLSELEDKGVKTVFGMRVQLPQAETTGRISPPWNPNNVDSESIGMFHHGG